MRKPPVIEGESLGSYVHRLAYDNEYHSIGVFSDIAGFSMAKVSQSDCEPRFLKDFAGISGLSEEYLNQMSVSTLVAQWGKSFVDKWVMKSRTKFCPECINEVLHHKLEWMLIPFTVCLKHRSLLCERCEGCNKKIAMESLVRGYCKFCGFDFNSTRANRLEEESILYQSQLFIQGDRSEKNACGGTSIQEFMSLANHSFHLVEGMQSFTDRGNQIIRVFKNQRDIGFNNMNVQELDQRLPFEQLSGLDKKETVEKMFAATEGSIRYVMYLIRDAAAYAIEDGSLCVNDSHLARAYFENTCMHGDYKRNPFTESGLSF